MEADAGPREMSAIIMIRTAHRAASAHSADASIILHLETVTTGVLRTMPEARLIQVLEREQEREAMKQGEGNHKCRAGAEIKEWELWTV